MPRYTVHLCAYRLESNRMEVEADTPEAACDEAMIEDDGAYEPFDLGESWVEKIEEGETSVDVPVSYREPNPADPYIAALKRLVECPDLNLDELEDETRAAIHQAKMLLNTQEA